MRLIWFKRKDRVKLDLSYYGDDTLTDEEKSARFNVALTEFMRTYTPPSTFKMAQNSLKQKLLRIRRFSAYELILLRDIPEEHEVAHKGGKNSTAKSLGVYYDETIEELHNSQ